jgi:hypothetical protein
MATSALVSTVVLLALSARAADTPGERPCVKARPGERFSVDYRDVPLATVARLCSCAAELDLVLQPADLGRRQVTVVAARPVVLPDLMALFVSLLTREGLELSRAGGHTIIRPAPASPEDR